MDIYGVLEMINGVISAMFEENAFLHFIADSARGSSPRFHGRSSPTRSLPSSPPNKHEMASSATVSEVPAALGSLDPRSFTPHSPLL